MIKKALQQRCRNERDYILSSFDCLLLTVKAVIAVLLRLEATKEVDRFEDDYVLVAVLDGGTTWTEWGRGGWYDGLMISLKWYEWRYIIVQDSYP